MEDDDKPTAQFILLVLEVFKVDFGNWPVIENDIARVWEIYKSKDAYFSMEKPLVPLLIKASVGELFKRGVID